MLSAQFHFERVACWRTGDSLTITAEDIGQPILDSAAQLSFTDGRDAAMTDPIGCSKDTRAIENAVERFDSLLAGRVSRQNSERPVTAIFMAGQIALEQF